ncbi:MAG TPA: DUF4249 family protein [Bacteroidales bacterium]|nr:DUF4249 family protein [Bacteroidales bacterium]
MKKVFLYTVLLICAACEKQTDWPAQGLETSYLVVDGMITNEVKSHAVTLTRTVNELNAMPQAVSGASVIISDADSIWFLIEDFVRPGVYLTKNNFRARPGVDYTLLISADGVTYSAKTRMVPVNTLVRLHYSKIAGSGLFHITWVANAYNAAHPAMYEVLLDWSQVPGFLSEDSASCTARLFYYSLPTLDVSEVFAPEIEKIQFPAGTKIVERKYSLTPGYVEFIRAMISETNWKGGLFDSAPANIPTNISNGALGFFAACDVITDSLVVQ